MDVAGKKRDSFHFTLRGGTSAQSSEVRHVDMVSGTAVIVYLDLVCNNYRPWSWTGSSALSLQLFTASDQS